MEEQPFSEANVRAVEKLVTQVGEVQARDDLSDDEKAAAVKKIEQEIHTIRGGHTAHHRGAGSLGAL